MHIVHLLQGDGDVHGNSDHGSDHGGDHVLVIGINGDSGCGDYGDVLAMGGMVEVLLTVAMVMVGLKMVLVTLTMLCRAMITLAAAGPGGAAGRWKCLGRRNYYDVGEGLQVQISG